MSHFLYSTQVHCCVRNRLPVDPVLARWIQFTSSYPISLREISLLSFPKWSRSLGCPTKVSHRSHACCMPLPSHLLNLITLISCEDYVNCTRNSMSKWKSFIFESVLNAAEYCSTVIITHLLTLCRPSLSHRLLNHSYYYYYRYSCANEVHESFSDSR